MSDFQFDLNDYKGEGGGAYEPLPRGKYVLKAVEAEQVVAKSGNGEYVKVKFEVAKGELTGRKIFVNFNIYHSNETAQRIGREQLGSWARACGKPNARNTDMLLEVEFEANVGIEAGKGEYGPSNRILGYVERTDGAAPTPTPSRPMTAEKPKTAAPAASASKPGARKNPWDSE
jgi:hypothetical protein